MKPRHFFISALFLMLMLSWSNPAQEAAVQTQTLNLTGLQSKVTVRRDGRGIPYIEAANDADLYFAQGFLTAQDRLWQMDLYRRVARGETAEIFGRMTLEEDKRWRKFGFAQITEESARLLPAELRMPLEAYARGVNAYIASLNENTLPVEFKILQYRPREWRAADSIILGKILSDALSNTLRIDLIKSNAAYVAPEKLAELFNPSTRHDVLLVGKDTPESSKPASQNPTPKVSAVETSLIEQLAKNEEIRRSSLERIGFYAEGLAASNNWVVSGKRTADGKPLLANDPHLLASAPPIWYLAHLSVPGMKVAGVTLPGTPGVALGHNEFIAWGATNVGPDVQDLYLEQFDPQNPLRYKTPTGWQDAEVRREEIKVRKSPLAPETETQILEVVKTRNGVIYTEDAGKRYALRWTAFDPNNKEFAAFGLINRAKNWDDFKNAVKTYDGPMQNFIYADIKGNIGWIAGGKIPKRKTGDGSLPYDGATDDGAWTGFVPFEELPMLYNPQEGIIVTANQRIVGTSYKHQELVRAYDSPFRARRIYDLLAANPKQTIGSFRDIQHDIFSIPLSRLAREIVNLKAASDETLKLFSGWDGRLSADSKAAMLANEMRNVFRTRILNAHLGQGRAGSFRGMVETAFFDRIITEKPQKWLPAEFSDYATFFKAVDAEARENLTRRYGADDAKWAWGEANKIRFPHPLAAVPFIGGQFQIEPLPQIGGRDVPNVGAGVSMRLIAAPGNWDLTRQVVTSGQSGDPKSVHWKDQHNAWYTGNTPVFPFSQDAVRAAAKQTLILNPQK